MKIVVQLGKYTVRIKIAKVQQNFKLKKSILPIKNILVDDIQTN